MYRYCISGDLREETVDWQTKVAGHIGEYERSQQWKNRQWTIGEARVSVHNVAALDLGNMAISFKIALESQPGGLALPPFDGLETTLHDDSTRT